MTETFLILLAAGVMLAAAVSKAQAYGQQDARREHDGVTLQWLRLAGIIALALGALGLFFFLRRETPAESSVFYHRLQLGLILAFMIAVLGQLAFVQIAWRGVQRAFALLCVIIGVMSGSGLLHELMLPRGTAVVFQPKTLSIALQTLACFGIGSMTGLALMDMLLGHAYLTASRMTMQPFRRLNNALAVSTVLRVLVAVGGVLAINAVRPVDRLWGIHGLFIATRYFVGFVVPAVFIYMAHDCIKRRSTQSATGILYVAGVLIFIGEIVALYLVRETGLPF
jgi:hypothetical protein